MLAGDAIWLSRYHTNHPVCPIISDPRWSAAIIVLTYWPAQSDQVYWNKIHPSIPILHYRRYMSWSTRTDKSATKECLQHCMWTIAASTTTEYDRAFTDRLYRCALQSMQRVDSCTDRASSSDRPDDLEQVQALLLLSLYELKHIDFRRGWITAGRAFSLIQLSLIQDIPSWAPSLAMPRDWVAVDEKRRAFWLAFCLDRFISLRNNSPCTLGDPVSQALLRNRYSVPLARRVGALEK